MRQSLTLGSLLLSSCVLSSLGCCPHGAESNVPAVEAQVEATPPAETATSSEASTAPASAAPEGQTQPAAVDPQLEQLYTQLEKEHQAELARLTPEIRAAAKALAEAEYKSAREAIAATLAGAHRQPGHAERDAQRHAAETLAFFGFTPSQRVLEYGPGAGWYTELLAPALARDGALFVTMTDPKGPRDQRATYYGKRTQLFLDRLPEAYGKVKPIAFDPKAPSLELQDELDLVLLVRGAHGMYNNDALVTWLKEFHEALKPGGVLGIVQHRAKAGAKPEKTSKHGYLPEQFVIEQAVSAGFRFAGKSEINANPKDTADHPEGVWTLPPTLRLGDKDREKYQAIGESDRMTLKFVKPAAGSGAKK